MTNFKEEIEKLGGSQVRRDGDDVLITFRDGVTFDKLSAISVMFGGTKLIDIGSEERQGGYCETCAYSYTVAVVNVRGKGSELPDDTETPRRRRRRW